MARDLAAPTLAVLALVVVVVPTRMAAATGPVARVQVAQPRVARTVVTVATVVATALAPRTATQGILAKTTAVAVVAVLEPRLALVDLLVALAHLATPMWGGRKWLPVGGR